MHIIAVTRILPFHGIGGMQVITWDLAKEFVRKGHKVTCITTSIPGKPQFFNEDGINVSALIGTKPGKHSVNWWKLSKRYIEDNYLNDCDVLLSVSASGFSVLSLKAKMKNTVFVFQGHGTSLSELVSKLRLHTFKSLLSMVKNMKWLAIDLIRYQGFDGIVAAGDRVYRDFTNPFYRFFLSEKRIVSIPNGIDLGKFKPSTVRRERVRSDLKINNDEFVILVASRLCTQKGVLQAVTSFSKYLARVGMARLIILGDGPETENITKWINQLGISNEVHVLGSVSIDQLSKYINASDVYLFPTLHEEGLPLLPLEALASGIPVIASEHLIEIIQCGDSVIAINPRNVESIVSALLWSKKFKGKGQCLLPSQYQLDICSDQYLTFFEEIKNKKNEQ